MWTRAEAITRGAMEKSGIPFILDVGGAAHYGPKIDFIIRSVTGREFAASTNQVDLYTPKQFGLTYKASDGTEKTPIVIHRAPLGSHERFVSFLTEQYGGAFPFWLAPEQIVVVPVTDTFDEGAQAVADELYAAGLRAEADVSDARMQAKIRTHSMRKVPVTIVVGARELEERTASVRLRTGGSWTARSMRSRSSSSLRNAIAAWSWTCRDGRLAGRSPAGCPPCDGGRSRSMHHQPRGLGRQSEPDRDGRRAVGAHPLGRVSPQRWSGLGRRARLLPRWVPLHRGRRHATPLPAGASTATHMANRWRSSGDSKIGQWMPALQRIAEVERWRVLFYSRSSCPFATEADQTNCSRFVERVFTQLRDEEKPKLIFSSHISRTDPVIRSESALLTQLHTAIGTRAVLLADTPQRGKSSIFDCLRAATDYVADCSFRKNDGSGTPALRAIAQQVPDAVFVTMNDVVCPTTATCPPVLDHILLYRAGSHLTKTFINALTPTLHRRLIEAGVAKGPVITAS
jgi:hypothetical protein